MMFAHRQKLWKKRGVAVTVTLCAALYLACTKLSSFKLRDRKRSPSATRRNLLVDDFGAWVNERVRTLRQFDPTVATFGAANEGGEILLFPDIPDPEPQETVNSYIAEKSGNGPHYLEGCRATSQFQLGTFWSPWILETLDSEGNHKDYGGDELYVTYKDANNFSYSPNAVARVVDMADGRYMLYFLKSRSPELKNEILSGRGKLTVRLIQTCGASSVAPPGKEISNFESHNGYIGTSYSIQVSSPALGELIMKPASFPKLASYDLIVPYGDSVMRALFKLNDENSRLPNMYKRAVWNVPLNSNTLHENGRDKNIKKYLPNLNMFAEDAKKAFGVGKDARLALLLQSCAWEMASHNDMSSWKPEVPYDFVSYFDMEDHIHTLRVAIESIKRIYHGWDIYWMGCATIHREYATVPKLLWAAWYANSIRARDLEARQREVMEELGIPYLDLFEVSYEMEEFYHDHVHFLPQISDPYFNHLMGRGDEHGMTFFQ